VKIGDHVVMVAFGAGFTSGAITVEWTADPANGRRAASIRPDDIRIRQPLDWNSVDPIQPALAAIIAAPGPVDVPLDDVVPGEPEHADRNGAGAHVAPLGGRGDS
jgi:hypothetical protein